MSTTHDPSRPAHFWTNGDAARPEVHDRLAERAPTGALLLECAWEVCNQLGGIYQVLRSKSPTMVRRWRNRYLLVGPYVPAKAALEATSRYIARDLGKQNIRCNLISAGPLGSMAAKSIPGFSELASVWDTRAPLEWDLKDPEPAGRGVVAAIATVMPDPARIKAAADGVCLLLGVAWRP